MKQSSSNEEHIEEKSDELSVEDEINYSKLTPKEQEELILEMHAEEMMKKQSEIAEILDKSKSGKKKRFRKKGDKSSGNIAPGFSWVVFKMSTAMTFSLTFIFLGIVLFFMSIFKAFGDRGNYDWYDLIFALVSIVLFVLAWFIFRYLIKG